MKTRIKKIIIMAVALLFVCVGVSFAHDVKGNPKKAPGNAYGHYKKGNDYHRGRYNKHPKPKYHSRDRYRYWKRHKVRHHYRPKYRHTNHGRTIIGFKASEPDYKLVVVVKDR